jgi:hypothetical protein
VRLALLAALAAALAACGLQIEDRSDPFGRRTTTLRQGLGTGFPSTGSACAYRLSTNGQCYPSLADCRSAGSARTDNGPSGYRCSSE